MSIPVTIFFAKDSPIRSGENITAQLLDESDLGFYFLGPGETKAVFIPRSTVSLVYFSDNLSGSTLLRQGKQ